MPPKLLIWILILVAILYLVWPLDVLPDWAGLIGRLDDVAVMAGLFWLYRETLRSQAGRAGHGSGAGTDRSAGAGDSAHSQRASDRRSAGERAGAFDPYAVLGIPRSADAKAIRAAYRARMQEYHPDKVAHLGAELQALANEKSQQIQRAYRMLKTEPQKQGRHR